MGRKKNTDPESPAERVYKLMQLSGLELSGFAELTGVSESHLYAITNGTKKLTKKTADKIANVFDLIGSQLLNPNFKLTKKIRDVSALTKFYNENKRVRKYFLNTRIDRKIAYFIEYEILSQKQFNVAFTVNNVRQACLETDKKYTSKRISQVLNYLVDTTKLKSRKERITKKDGTKGDRLIDVFWKNNS